jgi:hypothetical protein
MTACAPIFQLARGWFVRVVLPRNILDSSVERGPFLTEFAAVVLEDYDNDGSEPRAFLPVRIRGTWWNTHRYQYIGMSLGVDVITWLLDNHYEDKWQEDNSLEVSDVRFCLLCYRETFVPVHEGASKDRMLLVSP